MSELVKPKNAPKLKLSEVKKGGMIYPRSCVGLTNKKPVKKEEMESDFEEVQDNDDESSKDESSDY